MPDLSDGARAIDKLMQMVLNTNKVKHLIAKEIHHKALQLASSKPTPQARMVSRGMRVKRGVVIGFAGTRVFGRGGNAKLGHLAFGSEFGSQRYKQFGPRNSEGYWLYPAADKAGMQIDKLEDQYLDEAIDAAIRTAGP